MSVLDPKEGAERPLSAPTFEGIRAGTSESPRKEAASTRYRYVGVSTKGGGRCPGPFGVASLAVSCFRRIRIEPVKRSATVSRHPPVDRTGSVGSRCRCRRCPEKRDLRMRPPVRGRSGFMHAGSVLDVLDSLLSRELSACISRSAPSTKEAPMHPCETCSCGRARAGLWTRSARCC